jgi:hypothetical protein
MHRRRSCPQPEQRIASYIYRESEQDLRRFARPSTHEAAYPAGAGPGPRCRSAEHFTPLPDQAWDRHFVVLAAALSA